MVKTRVGAKRAGAFTLVELLIALSILSVISAISLTSFRSVSRVVEVNRQNEEAQRTVRGFVERLDVELAGAMYVRGVKETSFVSSRRDVGGKGVSDLSFATLSPLSYLEIGARDEVMRVSYEVKANEEEDGRLVLTKRVFFRLLTTERQSEPAEFVIREDLTSFALRFYEGGKWFESWDTEKMDRAPIGVELIFSLGDRSFREYFNVFISET